MWRLKILFKIFYSSLGIPYSISKRVGIRKWGKMDQYQYSKHIFWGHVKDASKYANINRPNLMEIGCGDCVSTAIYSKFLGAKSVYLVDAGEYATKDLNVYKNLFQRMSEDSQASPDMDWQKISTFDDLLKALNAKYMTNGLRSLNSIPDNSIDYIFSHAVLEHIRLAELKPMIKEMYRVLVPGGVMSHNIDYKDHLDESINNLRFPEKIWESDLFAKSGFYTNRVPAVRMHKLFLESGLDIVDERFGEWNPLPLKKNLLDKSFHTYADRNELVPTSSFIAKKRL